MAAVGLSETDCQTNGVAEGLHRLSHRLLAVQTAGFQVGRLAFEVSAGFGADLVGAARTNIERGAEAVEIRIQLRHGWPPGPAARPG